MENRWFALRADQLSCWWISYLEQLNKSWFRILESFCSWQCPSRTLNLAEWHASGNSLKRLWAQSSQDILECKKPTELWWPYTYLSALQRQQEKVKKDRQANSGAGTDSRNAGLVNRNLCPPLCYAVKFNQYIYWRYSGNKVSKVEKTVVSDRTKQ